VAVNATRWWKIAQGYFSMMMYLVGREDQALYDLELLSLDCRPDAFLQLIIDTTLTTMSIYQTGTMVINLAASSGMPCVSACICS
jgi:hypothetical protein